MHPLKAPQQRQPSCIKPLAKANRVSWQCLSTPGASCIVCDVSDGLSIRPTGSRQHQQQQMQSLQVETAGCSLMCSLNVTGMHPRLLVLLTSTYALGGQTAALLALVWRATPGAAAAAAAPLGGDTKDGASLMGSICGGPLLLLSLPLQQHKATSNSGYAWPRWLLVGVLGEDSR